MFDNISWQGYWATIAILTAGYYLAIYLLYYRNDFLVEWQKRSKFHSKSPLSYTSTEGARPPLNNLQQPSLFDDPEEFQRPENTTTEFAVYSCMDEINAYFEEAKRNKCAKEELLFALQNILSKYPAISTSEYKESLTNVVVNQCEYICSVHLSADDVLRVWVNR